MALYPQFKVSVNVTGDALTNQKAPSFLAIPYPATQVSTPPGIWLVDPELMVFSQYPDAGVQTYTATSVAVDPTAAQLSGAPRPPSNLSADLALPTAYKDMRALKQIADEETAGQTTEFGKVNALAAWLSGPLFEYSATAPPVNSAATLLSFLTKNHAGVCVQAAWAMTVLTRLLGIPARLAGGYTGGARASGDTYVVKTDDAHAWSEVYFTGYGWVRFEATPSGGDGTARAGSYQVGTSAGQPRRATDYGSPPADHRSDHERARGRGRGPQAHPQRGRLGRQRAPQVRRNAMGGNRPGDSRRHRPGGRGHRDRGPARAPGAVGP